MLFAGTWHPRYDLERNQAVSEPPSRASTTSTACPRCAFASPPGFRFCGDCGAPIDGEAGSRGAPEGEAERRQLTVLFCDLVGSTALSERLDPEELRTLIRRYQRVCARVVHERQGYIAQYLGDGILVYFGYPRAHEDDAERAVHAALGIIEAMAELDQQQLSFKIGRLAVRLAVHTGTVVIGEIGEGRQRQQLALGEAPNVAARLEALAEPDTILISGVTQRLVADTFICRQAGSHALRGLGRPVDVYRVVRQRVGSSHSSGTSVRSPMIGREQESLQLFESWRRAQEGAGHTVLVRGEAGIGKTRLVAAFCNAVAGEIHRAITCRCSRYYRDTAFYPLIDLLEQRLRLGQARDGAEKLARLEAMLTEWKLPLAETVPLWAALLSLPLDDRYPSLELPPQHQKQATLEAVMTWLRAMAADRPLIVVVHDMHWVDPSTVELLRLLIDASAALPVLLVLTARPTFTSPWPASESFSEVAIERLGPREVERLANRVAGDRPLPREVLDEVVRRADGVPLYVEELTRMVLASGRLQEEDGRLVLAGAIDALAIPETLQSSLMARLDRHASAKAVVQAAAVAGRGISEALLRELLPVDEETLRRELVRLVQAELLLRRDGVYHFKHALLRDAAYESLLRGKRRRLHERIGRLLAQRAEAGESVRPEILAHHFTEAGRAEEAIAYWQQAGKEAIARSANVEATRHLGRGLELVNGMPGSPQRYRLELTLQTTLGPALMAIKGFASEEVEQAYARAQQLCQLIGETPQLFPVLLGLFRFYAMRGKWPAANSLGKQLVALADGAQDPALRPEAHRARGAVLFHTGQLRRARVHLDKGVLLYDAHKEEGTHLRAAHHTGVNCRLYAALARAYLGYLDQAEAMVEEALALARTLPSPLTLTFALGIAAVVHQIRGNARAAESMAADGLALSKAQGFPTTLEIGTILHGWALAMQGRAEDGIARIEGGLEAWRREGAEATRTYFQALLADAHLHAGQSEAGLAAVEEGLRMAEATGERYYEAELHRLQGELLLTQDRRRTAKAEASLHTAYDLANRQGAKAFELRAVLSLYPVLASSGRRNEARALLETTYGWFEEGFETETLQRAATLVAGAS